MEPVVTEFREYDLVVTTFGVLMIAQDINGRVMEVAVNRAGDGDDCLVRGSSIALWRRARQRAEQKKRARERAALARQERLERRAAAERARYDARAIERAVGRAPRSRTAEALAREAWRSRHGRG